MAIRFTLMGMPSYRTVWRLHSWAGLFCIPLLLFLSVTGAIYLFKTEIEAWIDRPFDQIASSLPRKDPSELVRAAVAACPGSALRYYELPETSKSATRVVLIADKSRLRCYLDPVTGEVLHSISENQRLMRQVQRLHGELWIGDVGSYLVELAACWTVILVFTGLYLWIPRTRRGLVKVLLPQWNRGEWLLWRSLHGATGLWISVLVLLLIATGLPWANFWGDYFKSVRKVMGVSAKRQGWQVRSSFRDESPAEGFQLEQLNLVVETAKALNLPHPAQISPPSGKSKAWTVQSMTPNRPLRVTLAVDGQTGKILSRSAFDHQHPIDQLVGIGIAYHEGRLFGIPNQALGLVATGGLVFLCFSGAVLAWRRRPSVVLSRTDTTVPESVSLVFLLLLILLGVAMPLFGGSVITVTLINRALAWTGISTRGATPDQQPGE